jgi:uncharacterized protein
MPVTALYAGLLAPLYLILTIRIVSMRFGARIALGDGGDKALEKRIRAHGNFAEYVPFTLILLALAESLGAAHWALHGSGAALLIGRHAHAIALSAPRQILKLRMAGMMLTFTALAIAAAACLWGALSRAI